jgi:hypothetical protein
LSAAPILVSVLMMALMAMPAYAKQIWAVWDLDLGDHAPPTHFVLTVTSPTGAGVPPPMTIPWKTCTQPDMPSTSFCAPIGCPPTGTYVFVVEAQYDDGLSAPSNTYTCTIPTSSSVCDCTQSNPKPSAPSPPAPAPPPTIAMPAPPAPPPGMTSEPPAGMTTEVPPLPQQSAEGLDLQPVGDYPPAPVTPDPLGPLITKKCPTTPLTWKDIPCTPVSSK